jgi:molybdopterin molybdotransferase
MLSVDAVRSLIERELRPLPPVRLPLGEALGRRLAERVVADDDMPAFCRSAIDGYALPEGAGPGWHQVVGEVRPGMASAASLSAGQALKIFTGSALPESGIGLVMVEYAILEGNKLLTHVAATRKHVRSRGSQARRGEALLPGGMIITPGAVALLASVGATEPLVFPQPAVAHLVTGSELTPADAQPALGFIRDSNSPMIAALLLEAGAKREFHHHVSENVDEAVTALRGVDADVFLISGGASVGAYDGTIEILARLGFVVHCSKVNSRPGKPLVFATRGGSAAFGLPGNPLSHFVCFHLFVRHAIDVLQGRSPQRPILVRIAGEMPASDKRETWWPASVRAHEAQLVAEAVPWKDSSDVTSLAKANALLRIPADPTIANELVAALLFDSVDP